MMKRNYRSVWLLLLPTSLFLAQCTREGDDPEITRLHKSIETLEREITSAEEALKSAPSENTTSIQNDKELAKSRLERLKERLKSRGGKAGSGAGAAPSSSGGH